MATTTVLMARAPLTTTSSAVVYTRPTSTTSIITNIVISNYTTVAATFTMTIAGPTGTQVTFANAVSVAANSQINYDVKLIMGAAATGTQTVIAYASALTSLAIHMSGVEIA